MYWAKKKKKRNMYLLYWARDMLLGDEFPSSCYLSSFSNLKRLILSGKDVSTGVLKCYFPSDIY